MTKKMKVIKKFQRSGSINPITIEDYLNYWRDNNVETDEALLQRLAKKYGPDHVQKWIAQRQYERGNPYSVQTGTGTITQAPNKSWSTRLVDSAEDVINSNTLPGGLARTLGAATLGATVLTNLPAFAGGMLGGELVDKVVGGFGQQVENLTGIDSRIGGLFNPGYIIGGYIGNRLGKGAVNFIRSLKTNLKDKQAMPKSGYPTKKHADLAKDLEDVFGEINSVQDLIVAFGNMPISKRADLSKHLLDKYNFDIYNANARWKVWKDKVKPERMWQEYFQMGTPTTKLTSSPDVEAYYSIIAKPAMEKYHEVPPEIDDLFNSFDIMETYTSPTSIGLANKFGEIRVLDKKDLYTLAHEIHHILRNLLLKRHGPASDDFGYYTAEEQAFLKNFPYKDINEVGASLAEAKFAIFRDLKAKLHRYPTLEEFENYIKRMDIERLYHYFNYGNYSRHITKNLNKNTADKVAKAISTKTYPEELSQFNEFPNATKYSSPENMKAIIEGNETNRQAENIREALLKLGIATGVVAVGSTE